MVKEDNVEVSILGINGKTLNNEQKKIADDLDKIQIDQLHKATLNFSNNSLETKKLCVTMQIAIYTLLASIYKQSSLSDFVIALEVLGIFIPILFYAVDVVLYFYQDRLRENMDSRLNEIKKRNGLPIHIENKDKGRLLRSFFNGSQILYFGLIIVSIIAPFIIMICIKKWGNIGV